MRRSADSRRTAWRQGHLAEWAAAAWLTLKGYRLLARRYRTPVGEIDLVARRGRTIAFVEVKLRADLESAATSIAPRQQRRIAHAARYFLAGRADHDACSLRFDALLLRPWRLPRHITGAWWADR